MSPSDEMRDVEKDYLLCTDIFKKSRLNLYQVKEKKAMKSELQAAQHGVYLLQPYFLM